MPRSPRRSPSGGPAESAINADDVTAADLGHVRRVHGRLQAWAQGSALGAAYDSAQAPRPLALGDERESRAGERLPGPAAAPQPRVVPSRRQGARRAFPGVTAERRTRTWPTQT